MVGYRDKIWIDMSNSDRGRDKFARWKSAIIILAKFYCLFPIKIRKKIFFMCRNWGGLIGVGNRYALIKSLSVSCGDNVGISQGCYIMNPQTMKIGSNVSINPMCYFESGNFNNIGIIIGDDVSIAHGVTIMATSHIFTDINIPIKDQGVEMSPVVIENDVWIGAKVTVLAGVTIKRRCVIGANSVVTHDTEENGVYVGAPARKIKTR